MRIVKDPDERKQEIVDAAIRVFARKGYEKTSITDIAKELGISQGLCYRYFPSKEAIYEAGMDEYASYIVEANIQNTKLDGLSIKEQILKMSGKMEEYKSSEKDESDLYALFHKAGNHRMHDELFLRTSEKLVPYIATILEKGKARGEIHVEDTKATAYFFVFGQMAILKSKDYTEEEKTKRIQTCLLELLDLNN